MLVGVGVKKPLHIGVGARVLDVLEAHEERAGGSGILCRVQHCLVEGEEEN